jgi:hypothetical protein
MSKFIGRKIEVGIGREGTRGTAVAPSYWLSQMNADFDDKFEGVVDENSLGVIEDSQDFKVTKKWSEGKLSGKVCDKSFGYLLRGLLGTIVSAVKETTAYNHTCSVLQSAQHPTLTVEAKNPNEQLKFANGAIDNLTIKAELGKFVEQEIEVKAKLGVASTNSPSYVAENNFLAKDVSVKFADALAGLDAASAISVKNVEIKFEKNLESDDVLGSYEPNDYLNKQFAVSGSIELLYDATTYKALALAGTQKAMRINIQDTTVTIGASSNPTIKIDLAKVKLTEWAKSSELDGIVKETLTFKALYSLSDSSMVSVVLTNAVAGYN